MCAEKSIDGDVSQSVTDNQLYESRQDDSSGAYGCGEYLKSKDFSQMAQRLAYGAEEFVRHVWLRGWRVVNHHNLPTWLKDNDFLVRGHRPQLNTFKECFKSVFRIHTETGNIWSHLLGCGAFLAILVAHFAQPTHLLQWQDKLIISAFFIGAVCCMGFSCLFHTVYCHSETIGRLFNKLDYAGIAFLTMGSFVPYIYYAFYCTLWAKLFYVALIMVLGSAAIVVAMWDTFASPRFRPLRAGVFIALGLSGVIPCAHYVFENGITSAIYEGAVGWLALMGFLYILGAVIYATRVPERLFPGRFDLWFQSHQVFHVFVVIAAFVHYVGVERLVVNRITVGECPSMFCVRPDQQSTRINDANVVSIDANAEADQVINWIDALNI